MNCPDLKAYVLGESSPGESLEIRCHLEACSACALEAERLQVATHALRTLPDEEIPVHIRFVSDKVFEPRWWQRLFTVNFAKPAALAFLIPLLMLGSAFLGARLGGPHPVIAPAAHVETASLTDAEINRRIESAVNARLGAEVAKAASLLDHREDERTRSMLASFKHQEQADHNRLLFQVDNAYRSVDLKVNQFAYAANEKMPVAAQPAVVQ